MVDQCEVNGHDIVARKKCSLGEVTTYLLVCRKCGALFSNEIKNEED